MTSNEIRKTFLDFFASRGHQIVPSAPMVVKGDPTLMFINSGMAPFKNWFLGNEAIRWPRVADTQKCLRVSGKHNDLEEVGVDTYHHTMFEMLGNWSFGDYFKTEAISWAWELLTDVYGIPKDRLYVTVFEGDPAEDLQFDQEAFDLWKERIEESRILRGNKKDNFWEMGDQGPCGPCSEIHVDIRPDTERKKVDGRDLVNQGHPHVIEVWNNVFMQYNRKADGSLDPLPARHVDTGMGFERLCMVLQGKLSNYDTDVFMPLIHHLENKSGLTYTSSDEKKDIAMRVVADHVRAVSFAICDGQLPSSNGAGYVIRRILRRAIRYGYSFLQFREPFIHELVTVLAYQMGDYFPEIRQQQDLVIKVIREEEESFLRTLSKGIERLEDILKQRSEEVLDGKTVFELYDTFGFPVDLTALIAGENSKRIDQKGFEEELQKQKDRSRQATKLETGDWTYTTAFAGNDRETKFVGYDTLQCDSRIVRFRKVKNKGVESYQLVLDETPFYAESGGQVGDRGTLVSANERIAVTDTRKENNLIVHFTDQLPENPDASFRSMVDPEIRAEAMANHSATHLLHEALREVLGTHVEQKGSLVNAEYLRFDFSHFARMTEVEVERVESLVNSRIRASLPLQEVRDMPIAEAKKTGAMMLFGEKYGERVRVIRFGSSVELCGGTHVSNTGRIGFFKITSEGAVAAGVRRIEAISSDGAFQFIRNELHELEEVRELLKTKEIAKSVRDLQQRNTDLGRQIEKFNKEKAQIVKKELIARIREIGGVQFLAEEVSLEAAEIKDVAFQLRAEYNPLFAVLASSAGDKPTIACILSDSLVNDRKLNASVIIRELAKEINGGGGGQPFFATAGGSDPAGISRVLRKAEDYIKG